MAESERERLERALRAVSRELRHWVAWKNGTAMHPQREKSNGALDLAAIALDDDSIRLPRPTSPTPPEQDAGREEGHTLASAMWGVSDTTKTLVRHDLRKHEPGVPCIDCGAPELAEHAEDCDLKAMADAWSHLREIAKRLQERPCRTKRCVVCGALVCIEDPCPLHLDGCEVLDGAWSCSPECWEKAASGDVRSGTPQPSGDTDERPVGPGVYEPSPGTWFAFLTAPGKDDVGPFSSNRDAVDWLLAPRRTPEGVTNASGPPASGDTGSEERVRCSDCGKPVSSPVRSDGSFVVRAFVQCPECIAATPDEAERSSPPIRGSTYAAIAEAEAGTGSWETASELLERDLGVTWNGSEAHLESLLDSVGYAATDSEEAVPEKYERRRDAVKDAILTRLRAPHTSSVDRPDVLCEDAPFGSYRNQVTMWPPRRLGRRGPVGIDLCLASEIAGLWARGIATVSSCCGHGKVPGYISVRPEHEKAMRGFGYEQDTGNPDIVAFRPKTGCGASPPSSTRED